MRPNIRWKVGVTNLDKCKPNSRVKKNTIEIIYFYYLIFNQ